MSHYFLILMLKAPRLGYVKTRLAAEIGEAAALALYRCMVETLLGSLFSDPSAWGALIPSPRVVIACAPAEAVAEIDAWIGPSTGRVPQGTLLIPQSEGDLGRRLREAFETCFTLGARSVAALGGDCPDVASADVRAALDGARAAGLALGPARDGGYWAVAMNDRRYALLDNAPWGGPELMQWTLARAAALGLKPAVLAPKTDIDTRADLDALDPALRAKLQRRDGA